MESTQQQEYGVRWMEFTRDNRIITKEKLFRTEVARERFAALIAEQAKFWKFVSWLN